jgi:hypothetical protein
MSSYYNLLASKNRATFPPSLLLDLFPNASVAYSLRKLRTAYSGSAIRVRRSSDNAEQNIGFIGNNLDTASLLTFCGAGNGFVTTWYDQSTNGNNATQATAGRQAQIVSSSAVITDPNNNKTSTQWTGDNYLLTSSINTVQLFLHTMVFSRTGANANIGLAGTPIMFIWTTSNDLRSYLNSIAVHNNDASVNDFIISVLRDVSNEVKLFKNGGSTTNLVRTTINSPLTNWGNALSNFSTGYTQELIYWSSDLESSRNAIESEINNYYSVY